MSGLTAAESVVFSAAPSGRIASWSEAAGSWFGLTPARAIGRPIGVLAAADCGDELAGALDAAAADGLVQHLQTRVRRTGGVALGVSVSLTPLTGVNGKIVAIAVVMIAPTGRPVLDDGGLATIAHDISEQTRIERVNGPFAEIVAACDEAIIGADLQGVITSWNPGAERLYGYAAAEAVGQPITIIHPGSSESEVADLLARVSAGQRTGVQEQTHRRKDASQVLVARTVFPLADPDGRVIALGWVGHDITLRSQAERTDAHLAAIVASSEHAIVSTDLHGTILTWNPAARQIYGYAPQEAIGQHISLISIDDDSDGPAAMHASLAGGGPVQHRHARRRRKDGQLIETSVTLTPVIDPTGTVVGISGIARDVTESLRQQRERDRALSDLEEAQRLAHIGSWTWDPGSDQIIWSQELFRIFERNQTDGPPTGEQLLHYLCARDRERLTREYAQAPPTGAAFELEFEIITGRGAAKVLHVLGHGDPDRPGGYSGTVQDVSTARRAEQARIELINTTARAEAASQARNEFLARMSHELRTPMHAIIGFGQLLELDELSDQQRDSVRFILRSGEHLLALINDVLDITRIQSGKLTTNLLPIPVSQAIDDSITQLQPLARDRNVTVRVPAPTATTGHALADPNGIQQILTNLLANAIKYNHQNGCVTITSTQPTTDRVRITITDTGPGIPTEQLAAAFEPFERLAAAHTTEGTGLGLALSKALTEAMGGTLTLHSTPPTGTTAILELPASPNPPT